LVGRCSYIAQGEGKGRSFIYVSHRGAVGQTDDETESEEMKTDKENRERHSGR